MKKLMISLAALATALLAVSCQKESAEGNAPAGEASDLVEATLTASFEATKVTYTETAGFNLQPKWEIGDEVYAVDNNSRDYYLTVSEVSEDGTVATLVGSIPANGALHMMYKPYISYSGGLENGKMSVDYSYQSGDNYMPAMAFAEGTVVNGTGVFSFTNPGAVIGITNAVGVPAGTAIYDVFVSGVGLSEGLVTLENGRLNLAAVRHEHLYQIFNYFDDATDFQIDNIEVCPQNVVVNEDSSLSKPIFIAVPAGATVSFISIYGYCDGTYRDGTAPFTLNVGDINQGRNLYAGEYAYVKDQKFTPNKVQLWEDGPLWATCNIGGVCPADYGEYFSWGNVEPFIPTNVYMTGDGYFGCTPYSLSTHTTGIPDYSSTPGSSLTTNIPVDPQYDAAQYYWRGKWRMPTGIEILRLTQPEYVSCEEIANYYGTGIRGLLFTGRKDFSNNSIFVPLSDSVSPCGFFESNMYMRASDTFLHNSKAPVEYQYRVTNYCSYIPSVSSYPVFYPKETYSGNDDGPLASWGGIDNAYIPIRPVCDMDVSGGLSKYNGSAL